MYFIEIMFYTTLNNSQINFLIFHDNKTIKNIDVICGDFLLLFEKPKYKPRWFLFRMQAAQPLIEGRQ